MATGFKSFEPKKDAEGLSLTLQVERRITGQTDKGGITYDRDEGVPLQINSWPYEAKSFSEQRLLEDHPLLKERTGKGGGGS